jgi:maltokinase
MTDPDTRHPWSDVVLPWIERQRWFPGKGLSVRTSAIQYDLFVNPSLRTLIVEFDYEARPVERYHIPVLVRTDGPATEDEFRSYIGEQAVGTHLFDAAADLEGSAQLLDFMAERRRTPHISGSSSHAIERQMPHPVRTEQSNTSVVFGSSYIMKTLRQLWPGENPDLVLSLALDSQGSRNSARTMAWMTADLDGSHYTLITVQQFLAGAPMGWPMVQESLHHAAGPHGSPDDFAAEAHAMGVATATVHRMLATSLGVGTLGTDGVRAATSTVRRRLQILGPRVPELAAYRRYLDDIVEGFAVEGPRLRTQRIHNDLHLTQVMRTADEWVLIDFEGEPNASIEQRNELVPPWRDVACMLRSFNYGAFYFQRSTNGSTALDPRVNDWIRATRAKYLDGYTSVSGQPSAAELAALRFYEIEKALFEIDYDLTYRPTWIDVAVNATSHLLETTPT